VNEGNFDSLQSHLHTRCFVSDTGDTDRVNALVVDVSASHIHFWFAEPSTHVTAEVYPTIKDGYGRSPCRFDIEFDLRRVDDR
jgi:hypothetical protein